MDEIVKQALAKWPAVPHCTGWLLLDRRGIWRLRDEAAQTAGGAGDPLRHEALIGFINRNYEVDALGQWFFQNGPQRVYVELAYTPWIVRLHAPDGIPGLIDHTGAPFVPCTCWLDDEGGVLFGDDRQPARIAALHDHDLDLLTEHAQFDAEGQLTGFQWRADTVLPVLPVTRTELPTRFHFVSSPAAAATPQTR